MNIESQNSKLIALLPSLNSNVEPAIFLLSSLLVALPAD